jgi:phospho-N-acetylmuramoyl-pentapeptide-transferase
LNILIFVPFKNEILIYLILVFAAMLSGYLDDSATTPWGELKKGLIDLVIAVMTAVTYLNFNTNTISVPFTDLSLTLHPILSEKMRGI